MSEHAPHTDAASRRKAVLRIGGTVLAGLVAALLVAGAGFLYARHSDAAYTFTLPDGGTAKLTYGSWPALSNPEFYQTVKEKFVTEKSDFVSADLSAMEITVYKDGVATLTVPILAKGREGSWWETPTGIYSILTKEEDHFSSFGKVHQPYSLNFQGNFFIHGWPYYPDGTPVSKSYSGGCIRLSTEDAKKVYEATEKGMPLIVYERPDPEDDFSYELDVSGVTASSYLVADLKNGTVLASKDPAMKQKIASVTKLMTALIVTEYINLDKPMTVPQSALVYTSKPRLTAGASVSTYDLLHLLLTESSNEAAETLASGLGKGYFVNLMNTKSKTIGLTNTSFSDTSGASDANVSTAEDLFAISRYIYENRKFIFDITSDRQTNSAYGPVSFGPLENYNRVPGVPNNFIGGKIGKTTAAGETYAGVFMLSARGEERPVVVVALNSRDVYADVSALMRAIGAAYAVAPAPTFSIAE